MSEPNRRPKAETDDLLAHAIFPPPPSSMGAGKPEVRAAKALSVEVLGTVGERPLTGIWRAKTGDGRQVALVVVREDVPAPERHRLMAAVERFQKDPLPGVLAVLAVAPTRDAYLTELWTTGCATDLPALGWPSRRRLDFMRTVAEAVGGLHRAGLVHGCLCGDNVLLDDDLRPVLAEAAGVSVHALNARQGEAREYETFAAPEVNRGEQPSVKGDVYSLGRLMQHVLEEETAPGVLDVLRRCLAEEPSGRYATTDELIAAIDVAVESLPMGDVPATPALAPPPPPKPPPRDRPGAQGAKWTPGADEEPLPGWLSPAGLGAMVVAVGLSWAVGTSNFFVWGVLLLGAALAGWTFPPLGRGRAAWRAIAAASCVAGVVALNPLAYTNKSGKQRALHDPVAARAMFDEILHGSRQFDGMSLVGCDMSGLDLTAVDLSNVDLSHANLQRTFLAAANLRGVNLEGAQLQGAFLGTDLSGTTGLATATCDEKTTLQDPWHCVDGRVSR